MSWARLDDAYTENGKVADLSDAAFRADVSGICFAARNLTDGYIPAKIGRQLAGRPRVIQELVPSRWHLASSLCDRCRKRPEAVAASAGGTGYYIHDYLEYNPTRLQVETERAERTEAKQRGGRARAATAPRAGGRFTSTPPAESPADDQHVTSPVPVPLPVPQKNPSPPSSASGVDKLVALFARFGKCNEYTGDAVEDAIDLYSEDWVERAIKVAGKSAEGQPNWSFVDKVLLRWKAIGEPDDDKSTTFGPKTPRNVPGRGAGSAAGGDFGTDDWKQYTGQGQRGSPAAVT